MFSALDFDGARSYIEAVKDLVLAPAWASSLNSVRIDIAAPLLGSRTALALTNTILTAEPSSLA